MSKFQGDTAARIHAVIYCRVSSKKQRTEGSGLGSQEYRCRQYAEAKGYIVDEVFPDDVSGKGDFMKRKGMKALLNFLDRNRSKNYIVIFDDLKRYSRDIEFHFQLKTAMDMRGASRECLNFNFEETPEGKFNEIISVAAGQLEREQMARQNIQKSIARVEQGYWVNSAPIGYKYVKADGGGKVLVPDEPVATMMREALEGFASGRFASQTEVRRYWESFPEFPRKLPNGQLRPQLVPRTLRRVIYAGYVHSSAWGVSLRKGKHEPLISYETHKAVIEKLDRGVYAARRKDIQVDFPLRGAVSCGCCNTPLTAGWSKSGTNRKYAYYRCRKKGCELFGKGIARDRIESEFADLLSSVQPTDELASMAADMFKHIWSILRSQTADAKTAARNKIRALDKKVDKLIDMATTADNPRVIAAYEKKIEEAEMQRVELVEKLENPGRRENSFEHLFELAMQFVSKPCKLWDSGRLELRQIVLRLVFSDYLVYCREKGFLNSNLSIPFNILRGDPGMALQNGARGRI